MNSPARTVVVPADLRSATLQRWIETIEQFDGAGWPLVLVGNCDRADPLDGLAMAAFCAARTNRIGLCAVVEADTVEPFTLARGLATLDFMSKGRAAWRIAPGSNPERSLELIETVRKLLTSWDADALVADVEGGVLSNPDRVRAIAHEGAWFQVEGPLNVPRPPQGSVPLVAFADEGAIARAADLILHEGTCWEVGLEQLPPPPLPAAAALEAPFPVGLGQD
ncbi:LLM class flavin-dependent oxidoreductase [Novosphingobium resinovorum]|uniref:LLM class flavin-dependent oxidoreductase n=1 Tax=Novosphingobium resinovorum TaxID=158500 RepID=UPI002ED1DA19|nr:LLM class flavin-dependent oxidoreductase [Novosphingobium resinovorum]